MLFKPKTNEEIINDLDLNEEVKKFLLKRNYFLKPLSNGRFWLDMGNNRKIYYFRNEKRVLSIMNTDSLASLRNEINRWSALI